MAEEELNTLSQGTAPTPPTVEETGVVDTTPDPASLKAEIEQLEAKRKKAAEEAKEAEEKSVYWRKQKNESRADYFRSPDRAPERQQPPPVKLPNIGAEPKPADFSDYDKYVEALADHRAAKKIAEWEVVQEQKRTSEAQQAEMAELHSKLNAGYSKYQDYGEVAFDPTAYHITPMIVDILKTCDKPDETLYYLAKNRIEGVAISRMTPLKAAREIAKIESRLSSGEPAPPPKKPTTGAPPPINPLAGGTGGVIKDPEKMTQKEYEQWRAGQGARRF